MRRRVLTTAIIAVTERVSHLAVVSANRCACGRVSGRRWVRLAVVPADGCARGGVSGRRWVRLAVVSACVLSQ